MASQWVGELVRSIEESEKRSALALKRLELAEAAAPRLFGALARCMQAGVSELVQEKPYLRLVFHGFPSDRFTVSRDDFPCATLDVERNGIRIEVRHSFLPDETADRNIQEKTALFAASADGGVLVKYDSRRFAEVSELSQALLVPVVRFIGIHY